MANPQKENGYIAIATEIMEQLIQLSLSGSEWQVLLAVLRQTWGWQKKQDWISLTQFERLTKLPHRTVCRAKKS